MSLATRKLGSDAENLVKNWYLDQGYTVLATNFQYYRKGQQGRLGEIDLITQKGNIVCLVEVKARSNNAFGLASEQISKTKLRLLYQAFQAFVQQQKLSSCLFRFDLATVQAGVVTVIPNAASFDGIAR